jgi:hypothetical protein
MSPKNNIRGLVIRILLCSFGLSFGFSILTSKAYLQNKTTVANTNTVSNSKPPTPRPTRKTSANTNGISVEEPVIVAAPTPPANSIIRGRVFYADTGRAVKRSSIMLMNENGDGGPGSAPSALTDNEGYFVMRNVRAGTYYAVVNAPGVVSPLAFFDFSVAQNRSNEREAFQKAFIGFEKIVVDGITPIDIQVSAMRGGAVGGRVTYDDGDPAIGVRVEILRKVDDKFMTVIPNLSTMFSMRSGGVFQTDDRGVYRFSGLPAGEYIVKVTESTSHGDISTRTYYDMFDGFGGSSFLTYFYPDAVDSKSAQVINVAAGQEIGEINLMIPSRALYKAEGKIVSAKDKTPVRARITINRESDANIFSIFSDINRRLQDTLTDEDGNWKFKELPRGTYKIIVEPIESESTYRGYMGDYSNSNSLSNTEKSQPQKPKFAKRTQEIIVEDQDLSEIVVELGYGATITGTAVVENSAEMPRYLTIQAINETDKLTVSSSVWNYYNEKKDQQTTHDFKLENVTVGKNRLNVQLSGEEEYYVKSITANGVDLLANTFEAKEGETLRNVQIVLSKDVGKLKGTVTNDAKEPVSGAEFMLVPTDARRKNTNLYRRVRSDSGGEFITNLAPGEYAVVIFDERDAAKNPDEFLKWLDAAIKDAQKVKIEAGKTETVSLKKSK